MADAVALKDQGNAAFKAHDWPTAVDFYTKAIEKDGSQAAFYSNRAAANIKLEAYGYAIADASKCIELDPNNVKVRRRHVVAKPAWLTDF
jgi:serine/threonine-protein phosphatase 5